MSYPPFLKPRVAKLMRVEGISESAALSILGRRGAEKTNYIRRLMRQEPPIEKSEQQLTLNIQLPHRIYV